MLLRRCSIAAKEVSRCNLPRPLCTSQSRYHPLIKISPRSRSFTTNPIHRNVAPLASTEPAKVLEGSTNTTTTTRELLPLPRSLPPRQALLLLSIPLPPKNWPSHLEIASPLLSALQKTLKPRGIAVNAKYDGTGSVTEFPLEEEYPAKVYFPDGKSYSWKRLDRGMIDTPEFLEHFPLPNSTPLNDPLTITSKPAEPLSPDGKEDIRSHIQERYEILICTHSSRDCRCGNLGLPLLEALQNEITRQGMTHRIKLGEIAHVGGHKYAANALVLPGLNMFGNLSMEHAPSLVKFLVDGMPITVTGEEGSRGNGIWRHWRGRFGWSEDDQKKFWEGVDPDKKDVHSSGTIEGPTKSTGEMISKLKATGDGSSRIVLHQTENQSKPTVTLKFKTFQGETLSIPSPLGQTLLQIAKSNNLPALEGVCGGNLECATCHVYIPAGAPVVEPTDEELDMLGYALGYRDGESRLGCQIEVTRELGDWCIEGGVIGLPRY